MRDDFVHASDESLMEAYQMGDDRAFNTLYDRYSGRVYGFLRKRLKNDESARDVFQMAFVKLHRTRDQYNSAYPFSSWIFTVTRTTMLDWIKQKQRENVRLEKFALEPRAEYDETLPAPRIDLKVIPSKQREAVELRYMQELSYDEIAGRLGTSSANVRQLVSRGIQKLKSSLIAEGGSNES